MQACFTQIYFIRQKSITVISLSATPQEISFFKKQEKLTEKEVVRTISSGQLK